ncbi:MAG TPA: GNAT family N-acetyltransferase [Anaerolineales bacterium]|nr:GNAT family N-acetyltransferase [Anaerolineales bacterium]
MNRSSLQMLAGFAPELSRSTLNMTNDLSELAERKSVKAAIKANWEAYHYCLAQSPNVELSVGRYLTWLMTDLPDHFMNLVVCHQLPLEGLDDLIESTLIRFKSMNIRRLSWLTRADPLSVNINQVLLAHGLKFSDSFAAEMAVDLSLLPGCLPTNPGLRIVRVDDEQTLRQWIHIASVGFRIDEKFEQVWYDFFVDAIFEPRFQTYLALLDGKPVGTSQLFLSEGVAGIYNITCLPEARGQGIGSAITLAPLLRARELGYQIGVLQASLNGYNVYRRLGFQDFGKLSLYLWENDRGS